MICKKKQVENDRKIRFKEIAVVPPLYSISKSAEGAETLRNASYSIFL